MFGALNLVVQWCNDKGDLDIEAMTDQAINFFLRTQETE
jgi:hypothetical protein